MPDAKKQQLDHLAELRMKFDEQSSELQDLGVKRREQDEPIRKKMIELKRQRQLTQQRINRVVGKLHPPNTETQTAKAKTAKLKTRS